ncbi:MAG: OmpH family outer membrane protein [Akkermansia sp.]|nr:OmpH family outer membrane protein [Akkermansia sp.]
MKFPIVSTIAVALCTLATTVQAELKIATVNVIDVYTKYYKRFDTEAELQKQLAEVKKQITQREDELRAMQEDLKKLQAKYDPSLSQSAVEKLKQEFDAKQVEARAKEQSLKDFAQRRSLSFNEIRSREMSILVQDVLKSIKEVAAESGCDIVADSGALSVHPEIGIQLPAFPYLKDGFDITPEVIKKLNAGAPAGFDPDAKLKSLYSEAEAAPAAPAPKATKPSKK